MPTVGLDISDRSLRFMEFFETHRGLVMRRYGSSEIPQGVIEDGEIKNPDALRKILATLSKKHGIRFANVSLPEQHAYLLKIAVPKMKRSEIRGSIELQLEEHVPISAREAVFDYDILRYPEGDGMIELALAVLPRAITESYAQAFSGTGITPLAFEVEAESMARAVIPRGDMRTFMVMDFGKTRTGISIISSGAVAFTSTVSIGGSVLTSAIEKQFGVSAEEAEKIKREQGFSKRKDTQGTFLALMSTVAILRDEINKHYTYWHTHAATDGTKRPTIEKVLLCGGDANLAGLTDYLSAGLKTEVELANTMVNVNTFEQYVPEIEFTESLSYATAIGLALRPIR